MRKFFVVAALFTCSQSFSQDSTKLMEEVTLTASKFSTKTTATGKVVTIIRSEDIARAGSRDLAQVITEIGGVFINGFNGTAGKEKNIYLRGAKFDHTLITIDGVPVYDASGIGSNFDIRNIAIDNVERIEILKGSQSTLYGSDAIAGVINIIMKKNTASSVPVINGMMNYGSYRSFRSGTTLSGSANRVAYTLGFAHTSSDGFSEAAPKSGNTEFEKDDFSENSLNANLNIALRPNAHLMPFFRYTHFRGAVDADAFTDEKDFTNVNRNLQTGLRSEWNFGKAQLNLIYQYTRTERVYADDSFYVDANAYYRFNHQYYTANEHFGEAFITGAVKSIKLTAGLDGRFSNTGYDAFQQTTFSPYIDHMRYGKDSVKQHQLGAYAALNFNRANFSLEVGGRYNHHSEYGSNAAFNINPSYLLAQRLKIFANFSSGYRTPSLYQLFSVYGNPDLNPETSLHWEGGLQAFTPNGKGSARVSYFDRKTDDVLAFFFDPVTFMSRYINQDRQKDHGLEAEVRFTQAAWQFRANYTYVTGEITTKKGTGDTTYFNLLRRPKNNLNVIVAWQPVKAFYASIGVTAIGKRRDVYFDPVTFTSENIVLKAYTVLNAYCEYTLKQKKISLFADLRNITDKKYMDIYGYNTAGFNAYGGLRFSL